MTSQTIVFFGSSGSGKGTQANLLREYISEEDPAREIIYIETGRKLRAFIEKNTSYTARLTKEVIEEGGLLPEFVPIWTWTETLVKELDGDEHLILDGLSRRRHEAPILHSALLFYERDDAHLVYLKTSREWSKERLLERGREDDNEEDIKERLDWFYENTYPAIEYFKEKTGFHFIEINGEQSIEDVHQDIKTALFVDHV